jgi:O-antigen/teichoic acid export membrane protein
VLVHRLFKNSALLTAGSIAAQMCSAATFWLLARASAPREFGVVVGALGLAVLLSTVLDFGLNSYTLRELASNPEEPKLFARTFSVKMSLGLAVAILWMATVLLIAEFESVSLGLAMFGPYVLASMLTGTLLLPFRSAQRMGVVASLQVLQSLVGLIFLGFLIAVSATGSYALPLALTVGSILAALTALVLSDNRSSLFERPATRDFRELWSKSVGFGLASLGTQLQRADVAIVGVLAGPQAAGIFAAPARITNMLGVLPTAFSGAVFPFVAAQNRTLSARKDWLIGTGTVVVLTCVPLAMIFVFADTLVIRVLGDSYAASGSILRIYLVGMVFATVNGPLSALLQAEGEERYVAKAVGGAAIFGLLTVAVGAAVGGAPGAAVGFLALQVLVAMSLAQRALTTHDARLARESIAART